MPAKMSPTETSAAPDGDRWHRRSWPSQRTARACQIGGHVMTWVIWRQHRAQAIACLLMLVVIAAFTITAGTWMRATFSDDGLPACLARSGGTGCPAAITSFVNEFGHNAIGTVVDLPLLAISGLLGLAVGAPLLGQELERGTWRLAWSQTVPRTQWLTAKLGLVVGGLVLFGVVVTALMTWYHGPLDQVTPGPSPSRSTARA